MYLLKIDAYFYSNDKIDFTLDELGVQKPGKPLYEEKTKEEQKSFLAKKVECSDYYYTDEEEEVVGYSIVIFSSKFNKIMNQYNELVLHEELTGYQPLNDLENNWGASQVYYSYKQFVIISDRVTLIIDGDLNRAQAAKLAKFYMKNTI